MMSGAYRLGLIGYPLEHSLSPLLHQAALQSTGLSGDYSLYPIPQLPERAQRLQLLMALLRRREIRIIPLCFAGKPYAAGAAAVDALLFFFRRPCWSCLSWPKPLF